MMGRSAMRLLVAVHLLVAPGCRPEDQRTDSIDAAAVGSDVDPGFAAQLDSANAAFRRADLEPALRHYRRAIELDPDAAAGWFGIYLTERALGHPVEAEAALERARSSAPGASLLRPDPRGAR